MSTLLEQLQFIEKQINDSEQELGSFKKLKKFEKLTNFLALLVSYLIVIAIIGLLFMYNKRTSLSGSDWAFIFLSGICPGYIVISILMLLFEKPFEQLKYKLASIDRSEYDAVKNRLYYLGQQKEKIQKEIKSEEERIKLEVNKEIEKNFIFKINDAVYNIENRRINLIEAKQLQSQLEEDFRIIKSYGLYWYTSKYYNNRFEKIATTLKNYDVFNTPDPRPFTIPKTDNLDKTAKPIETKVEPFTPGYKPVAKTETPLTTNDKTIDKTVEPAITKSTETKVEPFTPIYEPVVNTEIPVTTKSEPWWNPEKKETLISSGDKLVVNQNESKIIVGKEKLIDELFSKKMNSTPNQLNRKSEKQPIKIDYVKLNEQRKITGLSGEKFALKYEKERLIEKGLGRYLNDIQHVSISDDSFGYDIKSFNEDGSPRYIEVKTTTDDHKSPFYITENEITAMENLENYFIYRVYNFDVSANIGNVLPIDCDTELEKYFEISPVSYRISPK